MTCFAGRGDLEVTFFGGKMRTPRQNPGYAYVDGEPHFVTEICAHAVTVCQRAYSRRGGARYAMEVRRSRKKNFQYRLCSFTAAQQVTDLECFVQDTVNCTCHRSLTQPFFILSLSQSWTGGVLGAVP